MLAHNELAAILKLKFLLNVEFNWTYESIEQLIPWQLDYHMTMLEIHLREKEARSNRQ
jgi:hypothetical protein